MKSPQDYIAEFRESYVIEDRDNDGGRVSVLNCDREEIENFLLSSLSQIEKDTREKVIAECVAVVPEKATLGQNQTWDTGFNTCCAEMISALNELRK